MDILVTGGTVFAGRYTAEYFAAQGHRVCVLNRGTRQQPANVTHIKADRHNLSGVLDSFHFDAVLDICAYTREDVAGLLEAAGNKTDYIFVSSSAVYPETLPQPFNESQETGRNTIWGDYGINKARAEEYLLKNHPAAYIIRPPYLYGQMNNLYREAFVFECADKGLPFYIPKEGKMSLQFFHIRDMCRFMEILLEKRPTRHIFNVGNPFNVTVKEWVELCYGVTGKTPRFVNVPKTVCQREYFPFYDYEYILDVSAMLDLMPDVTPMKKGLEQSYEWYRENKGQVRRKNFLEFIKENLENGEM